MDIFFSEEYTVLWAAISSIMGIIATIMAVFALLYSMRTYNKTMQIVHYGEIDKMYFEILKEALSKPHLARQNIIRTEEQNVEYDIYAFIIWNFLESIYDRCMLDENLKTTWFPIIEAERITHLAWIQNPQNRLKFKDSFLNFIDRK
ncbi:MAG: hypothetical protein PHX44_07800 [Sulfurimonas sp.]|uniref:hypothetical protein n=1 Tax=Sulfurimonas sp. TaxID=2022749 RepID=UPI002624F73F|nr:hypothetical protein [Sulfurimonas sp.]MDD2652939.1 hypothetical protein [Sulfurimonas sp.]MDD3452385.1 hypothetical protein [Sulfurimonas sp.]